jgi:hypothetical protein
MFSEHLAKRPMKRGQAIGQSALGIGANLTVGNVAQTISLGGDDAPAGAAKPRVEAEQDQASLSITSSGTS